MTADDTLKKLEKPIQYTLTLTPKLQSKLEEHLEILKKLHHPEKKRQTWLVNAIHEKFSRETGSQNIHKCNHLNLRLSQTLTQKLNERLDEIAKSHPGYSKKQWILDAIEEKLEAEREIVQEKLAELHQH